MSGVPIGAGQVAAKNFTLGAGPTGAPKEESLIEVRFKAPAVGRLVIDCNLLPYRLRIQEGSGLGGVQRDIVIGMPTASFDIVGDVIIVSILGPVGATGGCSYAPVVWPSELPQVARRRL